MKQRTLWLVLSGAAAFALAGMVLLAGCTRSSEGAVTTAPAAPAYTATTNATDASVILSDGGHFGFVREVAGGSLVFDPAEFLSPEEAVKGGFIGSTEELPDPCYIHNAIVEDVRLQVDRAARFKLLACDSTGTPTLEKSLSYDELARVSVGDDDYGVYSAGFASFEEGLPMYVTVAGGRVVEGREQYLP